MKKNIVLFTLQCLLLVTLASCEKVSPIGVLVSGTGVEDRVKMSNEYFFHHKLEAKLHMAYDQDEYTFLVGADSHVTHDVGRMREMLENSLNYGDLLMAHLGDIADTKAEYYINLEDAILDYKRQYAEKHYKKEYIGPDSLEDVATDDYFVYRDTVSGMVLTFDNVDYPFYPVVGNHDITHNGWALWSNIFHSSFYDVFVVVSIDPFELDHFIFLDTANGTLGQEQVKLINEGVLDGKQYEELGYRFRNTFVFSHTNIFRPSSLQFASTFPREETFFLLNQFKKWNANIVFMGHVHKWDEQTVGGVHYLTLDSMCEANNPEPGDYLVRVHVKKDGTITWERVHMDYCQP